MNRHRRRLVGLYRAVWWSLAVPLSVFGVGCAFLILGPLAALLVFGVSAGFSGWAAWELPGAGSPLRPRPGMVTMTSLTGGVGILALIGLTREWGAAGLGLSVLLAVCGADAWRRDPGGRLAPDRPSPGAIDLPDLGATEVIPPDPLPSLTTLRSLSTHELCRAWRLSYLPLRCPGTPSYRLDYLATLRQVCLDELEQRDPDSFRQWLPAARAASDPARFFCRRSSG